jgi:hypothetical protein
VSDPYKKDIAKGDYGHAAGRFVFDVGTLFLGGEGSLAKAGKAGDAARAGDAAKVGDAGAASRSSSSVADDAARAATCHSFDPATRVVMADGSTKPIGEIRRGDQVLATDPATGRTSIQKVTELHINQDTDLADVTVRAPGGATAVVHTTQSHMFWDATDHRWVRAADLRAGHKLRSTSGAELAVVVSVDAFTGRHEMRDLTVTTDHTYYVVVGNTPVLVHNCTIEYGASRGTGADLKRSATVGNDQWQFNTGHGFDRVHTGPGGVQTDLRTTGLTPDQIEQGIVGDVYRHMANGGTVPRAGAPGFSGPLERQVQVGGFGIGYRVVQTPDNVYRVATYWLNR